VYENVRGSLQLFKLGRLTKYSIFSASRLYALNSRPLNGGRLGVSAAAGAAFSAEIDCELDMFFFASRVHKE
jgi:hypothetical protein